MDLRMVTIKKNKKHIQIYVRRRNLSIQSYLKMEKNIKRLLVLLRDEAIKNDVKKYIKVG
jgi:hypothetical protein